MDSIVNREHKNSVFSALFNTPEALRELYSAVAGVDIPPDAPVVINTLSDALYMRQINDVSFTVNNKLVVLIEHQSTINENVPVRLLMYIARVYEKIIDREKLYQKKAEKIPVPDFIVLYNGKAPCPDHQELRLSAAFKNVKGLSPELPLELVVNVYNINHGRNPQILEKSETLNNYSIFMDKINEYKRKLPLEEAMESAIKYCIERRVLKQFLEEHGAEVINMLFGDISYERIAEIRAEEAAEEAYEEAYEEACVNTREEIACNALAKGLTSELVQEITGLDMETIQRLNN